MHSSLSIWQKVLVWLLVTSLITGTVPAASNADDVAQSNVLVPDAQFQTPPPIKTVEQQTTNGLETIESSELQRLASSVERQSSTPAIVEKSHSSLPAPFMLAQATPIPTPTPLPSISTLDAPVESIEVLETANEVLAEGHPGDAALLYIDTLDQWPDTEASVYAYRRLADLSEKTIRGEISAEETERFAAGLPTWQEANSAESKYILLGFSYTLAAQAKAAGDENAARQHFETVSQQAIDFFEEYPSDPLQIFAARHLEEAVRELGGEAEKNFETAMEAVVRENEPGPANWSARAVLAHHYLARENDSVESAVHRASMIDDWELAGLNEVLADRGVYDSVKAWYVYYLGHALFATGAEQKSLEYFNLVLQEYPEAGPVRELAAYHKAFALHSLSGYEYYSGISAYQEFVDAYPESVYAAKALLRMANIYVQSEDYDYALDILQEAKQTAKESQDAAEATATIEFLKSYVIGTQEVAPSVSEAQLANACGPISLHYLLASVGTDVAVEDLVVAAGTTGSGTSMQGLVDAAAQKNIALNGVRATSPQELPTPYIAFVRESHFVLVLDATTDYVVYRDLHRQPVRVAKSEFLKEWHGEALILRSKLPAVTQLAKGEMVTTVGGSGGGGGGSDVLPTDQDEECPNRRPFYWGCVGRYGRLYAYMPWGASAMSGANTGVPDGHGTGSSENVVLPRYSGVGMPMDRLSSGSRGVDVGIQTEGVHAIYHSGTRSIELMETDIAISTVAGMQLNLVRGYSAPYGKHLGERADTTKPYKNNIGSGWSHGFNAYIRNSSQYGTLVLYKDAMTSEFYYKTGQQVFGLDIYKRDETVGSENTGMTADKGVVIYRNPTTGTMAVHLPGGHVYNFSTSVNSVSRLTSVNDAKGNSITLEYDTTTNWDTAKLLKVKTPSVDGRYIEFTYNSTGLITRASLKKPATPTHVTLQFMDYTYGTETDGGTTAENHYLKNAEFNDQASVDYDYRCGIFSSVQKNYITQIRDRDGKVYYFDWTLPEEFPSASPKIVITTPNGMHTNYVRNTTTGANTIIPYLADGQAAGRITQYFPNAQGSGVEKSRFFTTYPYYEEWNYAYVTNRHDLTSVTPPGASTPVASYTYTSEGRVSAVHAGSTSAPAVTWSYNTGALYPFKKTDPELGDTTYDYFDGFGQSFQLERVDEPFFDDFDDEDYNRWTVTTGQWSASTGAMRNNLSTTTAQNFAIGQTSPNPTIKFRYMAEVATTSAHYLRVIGRQNSTTRLEARFQTNGTYIMQYNGTSWSTLGSNTSATTVPGTWYDVTMKYNGTSMEVWRGLAGETQTLITSTNSATVTTSTTFLVQAPIGSIHNVDDILIVSPTLKGIKTYAYDSYGQLSTLTTNSTQTTYGWDTKGNLTNIVEPGVGTTSYQYDDLNNVTKITTPDALVRDFFYTDSLNPNKVTEIHYSDSRPDELFAYTRNGELELVTDENVENYKLIDYNADHKVTNTIDSNGDSVSIQYNSLGQPTTVQFENLGTYTYEFDHMGRVKRRVNYAGVAQNFTYTQKGELASVTSDTAQPYSFEESENPTVALARQIPGIIIESGAGVRVLGHVHGACEFYCWMDKDHDGVPQCDDNCPFAYNSFQTDTDRDGIGDVCDRDQDSDTILDVVDNCKFVPNKGQWDYDGDGVGDACDNCPRTSNANQADADNDRIGDVCETDDDRDDDGHPNNIDNCPDTYNPDQADEDHDNVGDVCDTFWDRDGDGIQNGDDNCPDTYNPDQADWNNDDIGDACEDPVDVDEDGVLDRDDNCPNTPNPTQADFDADNIGDACESISPCLVRNGGFESQADDWRLIERANYGIIQDASGSAIPASGTYFAWFGTTSGDHEISSLTQPVYVPDATTTILKFKFRIYGGGASGTQYFHVLADGNEIFKIFQNDAEYYPGTAYRDVQLDLSQFGGKAVMLKFEALASSVGFLMDDLCIVRYGTEAGGSYNFGLNSITPAAAVAGANVPVYLRGQFGLEGTDYDTGSLQIRVAAKGQRYSPSTDINVPIVNADDSTIEIVAPDLSTGSTHLYAKATRNSGADVILTNLLPYTAQELVLKINSVTPVARASRTTGTQISLKGLFHDANPSSIQVKFDTDFEGVKFGSSVGLNAEETAITVTTPTLSTTGDQDATVSVSATVNGQSAISNSVPFVFFEPEAVLDPLGDCSSNLVKDPSFELGVAGGIWSEGGGAASSIKLFTPVTPGQQPFSGDRFLLFNQANAYVQQQVIVPVGKSEIDNPTSVVTPVDLRFKLRIGGTSPSANDILRVKMDGNTVYQINGSATGLGAYQEVVVDLEGLADDSSHILRFETTQSNLTTRFFVDDVALTTGEGCEGNWGIDISPRIVHFGFVEPQEEESKTIRVTNTGTTRLVGEVSLDAPFTVDGDPRYDLGPGHYRDITLVFSPTVEDAYQSTALLTGGGGTEIDLLGWSQGGNLAGNVIINEIGVKNTTTIADEEGDYSGWIELYNYSDYPVNLQGWKLSHKPTGSSTTTVWTFPETLIGARDYALVFASNKSATTIDGGLHTNFVLSPTVGGQLRLQRSGDGLDAYQSPINYPSITSSDPKGNAGPNAPNTVFSYIDPKLLSFRQIPVAAGFMIGDWVWAQIPTVLGQNAVRTGMFEGWYLTVQKSPNFKFWLDTDNQDVMLEDGGDVSPWFAASRSMLSNDRDGEPEELPNGIMKGEDDVPCSCELYFEEVGPEFEHPSYPGNGLDLHFSDSFTRVTTDLDLVNLHLSRTGKVLVAAGGGNYKAGYSSKFLRYPFRQDVLLLQSIKLPGYGRMLGHSFVSAGAAFFEPFQTYFEGFAPPGMARLSDFGLDGHDNHYRNIILFVAQDLDSKEWAEQNAKRVSTGEFTIGFHPVVLAHEVGHISGIADHPKTSNTRRIMTPRGNKNEKGDVIAAECGRLRGDWVWPPRSRGDFNSIYKEVDDDVPFD